MESNNPLTERSVEEIRMDLRALYKDRMEISQKIKEFSIQERKTQ
jgi:hypothetical protein